MIYGDDEVLFPVYDSNQEEYVPVSSFTQNKSRADFKEEDQALWDKYGVKKESRKNNELYYYYCTICGRTIVIYDTKLEEMNVRKLDGSIILDLRDHYFKSYVENGDIMQIVHEDNSIESTEGKVLNKVLFINCKCGCEVGYYSISKDMFLQRQDNFDHDGMVNLEFLKNKNTSVREPTRNEIIDNLKNLRYFYVLADSIVMDAIDSQVFINLPDEV